VATNLKLVDHSPAFTEFCEGCGKTKEGVRDIELQSRTGRQIARTFLCPPCRKEAAELLTGAVK
jgi:hypothetical protein